MVNGPPKTSERTNGITMADKLNCIFGTVLAKGTLRQDFLSSVVVFLVALPLCMGIAIASGVPTEQAAAVGIITGITGGIVVGLFAGSPLLVTGPAAGLSVLVFDLVQRFGWEKIGLIVLISGLIQLVAGLVKLGQWFRAVSPAVIYGMLAGIGVLIIVSQFHIMLDDAPRESGLANIAALPEAIWRGIVPTENATHDSAARIGLLTIAILVFWKKLAPQVLKTVPAPLVAVIAATGAAAAFGVSINQVTLPENLATAISLPSLAGLNTWDAWQPLLIAALSIAFIASAETLLSAAAVDQMHQGPRTRYDRELAAQGIGNMVSGFLGALPMTGVIVRSATNVQAGARSAKSEILHSVWLLLFVVFFPFILRLIPTASLAAILVYTGFKLVDLKVVRELRKFGVSEVLIYVATVLLIVGVDLLTGVIAGVALSVLKLLVTFSHLRIRSHDDPLRKKSDLYLEGTATFLRLPKLAAALESVAHDRELHVHFDHLDYIDHACLNLLVSWEKQHSATGGSLVIDWDSLTARFHQPRNGASSGNEYAHGNGNGHTAAGAAGGSRRQAHAQSA
jgi:MFS superfamily sulfate permease-like transporter